MAKKYSPEQWKGLVDKVKRTYGARLKTNLAPPKLVANIPLVSKEQAAHDSKLRKDLAHAQEAAQKLVPAKTETKPLTHKERKKLAKSVRRAETRQNLKRAAAETPNQRLSNFYSKEIVANPDASLSKSSKALPGPKATSRLTEEHKGVTPMRKVASKNISNRYKYNI